MKLSLLTIIWSTGIAIFSMFFGSGNVVFPLLLGETTGAQISWAMLGMLITAVGAPLLGLLASVLFQGDCKQFFYRIGEIPGYLMVLLLLALLGPIGVIPRCIVVAFGAVKPYLPHLSLWAFSLISGVSVLLAIARRNLILPLLGLWLSPALIITLLIIVIMALIKMPALESSTLTAWQAMLEGLTVGYNTMDLLASILFSVSIWILLNEELKLNVGQTSNRLLVKVYIFASLIGGGLLALSYVGLSLSAAGFAGVLKHVPREQVLSQLAIHILGPKLSIIANIAILLACFTTIISLAVAVVDVIHVEINNTKIGEKIGFSYNWMMFVTVFISVIFSNLGFEKIMGFLGPVMTICYPAIIVLALCNILYKLFGFKFVKVPFYMTLGLTLIYYYL